MQFSFILEWRTTDAVSNLKGCKNTVMLHEKVVYAFCGPRESIWQITKETFGMCNKEEY